MSLRKATAKIDLYACRFDDGSIDYETTENLLADQESRAAPLLARFAKGEVLDEGERAEIASFLSQMMKRGTAHEMREKVTWAQTARRFPEREDVQAACVEAGIPFSEDLLAQLAALPRPSEDAIPDNIRLALLTLAFGRTADTIRRMHWHLGIPRDGQFITGDNPIFFPEGDGLGHPSSEVYFALSPTRALIAAWRRLEFGNRVLFVDRRIVEKVNSRIAAYSREVIASRASPEILELLEASRP